MKVYLALAKLLIVQILSSEHSAEIILVTAETCFVKTQESWHDENLIKNFEKSKFLVIVFGDFKSKVSLVGCQSFEKCLHYFEKVSYLKTNGTNFNQSECNQILQNKNRWKVNEDIGTHQTNSDKDDEETNIRVIISKYSIPQQQDSGNFTMIDTLQVSIAFTVNERLKQSSVCQSFKTKVYLKVFATLLIANICFIMLKQKYCKIKYTHISVV